SATRTERASSRPASARAPGRRTPCEPLARASVRVWPDADRVRGPHGWSRGVRDYRLCSNSNCFWLARPEGDDAADGIVRRDADGHAISGNHLDSEAAHPAAELG